MAIKTIQANIKRCDKDIGDHSLWFGGLDVTSKNIDQLDPLRIGFNRIFITRLPRFMERLDVDMSKRFKHMVELGNTGISGIANTTLGVDEITGSYANNKFHIPTLSQDETDQLTIKVFEMSGSPVREFIDTWVTGIMDPLVGLGHYHGEISETCPYRASNHTMEGFYVATDPTGMMIEYACMFANMFPKNIQKQHFEYESGNHAAVPLDIEFTATRYESPQINTICMALLDKFRILRDYLNFNSGYTVDGINSMEDYNLGTWETK